jgi:hypothetical protein
MKLWATAGIFPQDPWRLSSGDPDLIVWQTKISELSINLRLTILLIVFIQKGLMMDTRLLRVLTYLQLKYL